MSSAGRFSRCLNSAMPMGVAEDVVDGGEIEVQLAGVFGLEGAGLQIDDDEAAEFDVVEKQAEECEAAAEFEEEFQDAGDEAGWGAGRARLQPCSMAARA